jgi:hypothetical protein
MHSAHTTLLLDDSPLKAHLQPYNHLCIREYLAELRNADLAFHASEQTRLRQHTARLEEQEAKLEEREAKLKDQEAPSTESEVQSGASASPVTDGSEPNGDEGDRREVGGEPNEDGVGDEANEVETEVEGVTAGKRKRRRRLKKKKQTAGQGEAPPTSDLAFPNVQTTHIPTPTYDQTLLAVIGILDHIKHESNIAGWMRHGGLLDKASGKGKGKEKAEEKDGLESSQEDGRELKRRRISAEPHSDEVTARPASFTALATEPHTGDAIDIFTPPNDTGQWYEDPLSMANWVRRGISALEKLGIEVVSGVDG